ncbi:DUF927 domain-containing protein [Avibacterium sp. 20-15]|uniref:DUF927 domain-containing protein n=1 Tax=unclassified Avibacterium TaxID=2685287 RepID=UPI0020265DB9|nr:MULTISPECIES: DUF927 domain-containing protein [unclassified Avibacterium]MCW9733169.1 DUF927 domain-containing protein [Avibacterium sp. 20-15]URL05288.1 DUF927 domain-containing protein [Avibacterium sp. 20-132]
MKKFIKNAPHLKEPWNKHAFELLVLVGSRAWQAWDKGAGIEWRNIADGLQISPFKTTGGEIPRYEQKPVILGDNQLAELANWHIATDEQRSIKLIQCGELSQEKITALCLHLATTTKAEIVELVDGVTLSQIENLSGYIQRLREQGEEAETAKIIAQASESKGESTKSNNLSPYIEKRAESGKTGLYRIIPKLDKDTGEIIERVQWLSDVVDVVGIGRSESESYLVLQWQLENSQEKVTEALPLGDIGEREGWRTLKNRGLKVTSNATLKNELADYLQTTGDRKLWTITNATGWQNGAYLLPNGEVIGEPDSPVLFRSQSAGFAGYQVKGTLESWQNEIGQYAKGNASMMLGVACALSAPLIHLLEADSFGVHLFGGSTSGKTTTANIAASIYGHPEITRVSWNATALGLSNEAAARNDGFLVMDEIGQGANKKHAEQTAYTLFNGIGKVQGAKDGGNREVNRWRIMAFSTGEIDLEGYLSQAGIKTNAGQLVRLLNIPITSATQFHHFKDGKTHADHLNQASKKHYGAIGREWITWLISNQGDLVNIYQQIKNKWLARLPQDASPQVQRVASRFAVLETALTLSSHLTLWTVVESAEALLHCFNEWVNVYGLHSREEMQVIEQVNGWLLANAEGRFIHYPLNVHQPTIHNIAGYRMTLTENNDIEHFYLYPMAFEEAINGNPKEQACQILLDKGILKKGNEKGYKYMTKLPHKIDPKRTRCYLLYPVIELENSKQEA